MRNGENKYYIENDTVMNWASHEATANICGGHLASVTSSTEMTLVVNQWEGVLELYLLYFTQTIYLRLDQNTWTTVGLNNNQQLFIWIN